MVAFYDVLFRPRVPLHIGQHISIHALLPYNGEYSKTCGQGSPRFLAEDTGIEGTITEVRAMEETVTELVMRNDNAELDVAKAVLAIQHIEGVTVRLPKWKKLLRATILRPLPETRWIPIEPDAAVVKKTTRNEPPIIPLCLRCGLPSATNEQREWAWRLMEGEFGDLEDPRAVEAGELGVWGVMAADNEATGEGAAGTSE
ncbi:hypothetical protein VTO73DRAFT_6847 [Trametes versicolor]